MYEDDELRSGETVNETAGQNAGQSSNSYFDYTTYSTEDLNQKADVSKAERRKQDKAEKKAAKAERKAAKERQTFQKICIECQPWTLLRTVCGSWFLWCPVGNRSADRK